MNKYHLNMQSLLQASPSVQHYWEQLQCSVLTPLTIGSNQDRDTTIVPIASENVAPEQRTSNRIQTESTKPQSSSATTHIRTNNIIADSSIDGSSSDQSLVKSVSQDLTNNGPSTTTTTTADSASASGTSPAILESMVRARCKKLRDKHGVQPGKSWGTLPLGITHSHSQPQL